MGTVFNSFNLIHFYLGVPTQRPPFDDDDDELMMIGPNPGPRARAVKPGPRHLRTRPDPGQNRLGPHKGIPSGEARQCTPAGTETVISALAPTAPPPIKAAQNATTVDTRSKTVALCTRRVHLLHHPLEATNAFTQTCSQTVTQSRSHTVILFAHSTYSHTWSVPRYCRHSGPRRWLHTARQAFMA